ncbi:MAG: FAD-dependent oxidoreductase [Rhodospirillaceae bacterium]|nr:FAD-dependent oxidoreductase [Rhodospirillaceae bacterium]
MSREPRFDPLFQPLKIGPVTAPNRFYQVPHCSGMGFAMPETLAAMRAMKAAGGWGVVATEYCSIDPSADDLPSPYATIWDQGDVRNMAKMTAGVHAHGSLAAIELWHGGFRSSNLLSRATPMGPVSQMAGKAPVQSRRMDLADIRDYRRAHRAAALRAREADFDIVYVYAAHGYLIAQFLNRQINQRDDGYGGSLEDRARILRELLEETKEAVGDRCAVAIRIEIDDEVTPGSDPLGEKRALFEMIRELPDLFDVTITDYGQEMGVSRFHKQGSLEPFLTDVRKLVGKPVVSVGRYTAPEAMLSAVKNGIVDMIGAARPSIADPFLPNKIRDGRLDDIRECIGCNICYASDIQGVPLRCTQNPTMGEEWRRDWHPEIVASAAKPEKVLVVGAGPAGLEAALTLGRQGHEVILTEASRDLGGRVLMESKLPGLQEWIRVRDYRAHQLSKLDNVAIYRESRMNSVDVHEIGAAHVLVATGSRWRKSGLGRYHLSSVASFDDPRTLGPEEIMAGKRPEAGPVIVFDDEGYLMASALAELLAKEGRDVTYVATAGLVSAWSFYTNEQHLAQARLIESGVRILVSHAVTGLVAGGAELACVFTGRKQELPCAGLVPVTSREPNDALWRELGGETGAFSSLQRIGDCKAPAFIATAIHDGHRAARELGVPAPFKRDRAHVDTVL